MKSKNSLDWFEILERLSSFATCELARTQLLNLKSTKTPEEAIDLQSQVFFGSEVLGQGLRPHFSSLDMFSPWMSRLKKKAVLKTLEIKDVRHFCLEALALKESLVKTQNPWSMEVLSSLMEVERPLSAIDQVLTPGGEIRADASERLYQLFTEKERLGREVQGTLDRLVRDHKMENLLQEKFVTTREGRWVLPIKGGMQHFMPGVIHGSSQTKQTVFMEPEKVIPLNNRLRQIDVEIEDEIERILTELSHFLHSLGPEFETARALLEEADIVLAKSQLALALSAAPVEFSEGKIKLNEVKHPLLILSGKTVIPNSVDLDERKSILLLSGPNAGGKTVLLKSIGLAAEMARCGLPICAAAGSTLPFFRNIHIAIGDSQDVGEDLSTFAAHLGLLQKASEARGLDQLILVDEICGSTDPEEGSALARSFIERFAANHSFAIITSHLSPLKSNWNSEDPILNGSLEYDTATGRPTYHFLSGIPGDSLALQTAKRVGVDPLLIARALEVLSPASRERLKALEELEHLKKEISNMQAHWRQEIHRAEQQKQKYEKLVKEMEKDKQNILEKTAKKAEKKVEEAIAQAKVTDVFNKHRQLQEIKFQLPDIIKSKSIHQNSQPENDEAFAQKFPPGTKIHIPSLGQDGLIQSTPNAKGEVLVLSNSIRLQIPWRDLKPPHKPDNPTAQILRQHASQNFSFPNEDRVLDLRGKTVDEALEEIESQLDLAIRQQEDRLKIIHGHGTEALKKAVRSFLSRSVFVQKWKAGTPENGGDGITWVELTSN